MRRNGREKVGVLKTQDRADVILDRKVIVGTRHESIAQTVVRPEKEESAEPWPPVTRHVLKPPAPHSSGPAPTSTLIDVLPHLELVSRTELLILSALLYRASSEDLSSSSVPAHSDTRRAPLTAGPTTEAGLCSSPRALFCI